MGNTVCAGRVFSVSPNRWNSYARLYNLLQKPRQFFCWDIQHKPALIPNKTAQNNLGTGRIVIPGRSTRSCCLTVFARRHSCAHPSNTQFLGPTRLTISNSIWIASAVFSQYTLVTNGQRRQNLTGKSRPLMLYLAERRRPVLITTSPKTSKTK